MKLRQGGLLIAKIHQLAGRIFAKKLKKYEINEINPAQGRILFVLWQRDAISIQELAEKTSLGKSTLTRMLDKLEETGHIKRIFSQSDRRKIYIELTDKNRALKDLYDAVSSDMLSLYYQGFSDSEIGQFEQYLARIHKNLAAAEKQPDEENP